jgi:hypothetical protein
MEAAAFSDGQGRCAKLQSTQWLKLTIRVGDAGQALGGVEAPAAQREPTAYFLP